MIWGCMTAYGLGEAHVCEERMSGVRFIKMLKEVLEASIVKFYDMESDEFLFQQDNYPWDKSRLVMQWFIDNRVKLFDSPCADLLPIENLWHILKETSSTQPYFQTSANAVSVSGMGFYF